MRKLRIALTKGRLEKQTVALFEKMGLDCTELHNKGRRLILPVGDYEAVLAKAADVVTYVEHGVCDIGVVGRDTIVEYGKSFYEVCDLGLGKCDFCLAGHKGVPFHGRYTGPRIDTTYPNVARAFFQSKGMDVNIIKIEGSVELAPLLDLSDAIVDIVETGTTLRENGLEVYEKIMPISARVIVNTASMKLRREEIDAFVEKIGKASQEVTV